MRTTSFRIRVASGILALACGIAPAAASGDEPAFRALVEADWRRQEEKAGRSPSDPAAIREAIARARRLVAALSGMACGPNLTSEIAALDGLARHAENLDSMDADARLALYREIRWTGREVALKNPLLAGREIAFLDRRRFICQMLHEYLGYFFDYGDIEGGGVYVIERPGRSAARRDLIRSRLPRGNYTTLSLSYDARTLYFAFAPRAAKKPDYYSAERRCFHIYAVAPGGADLRPLTSGPDDDFDPCPLPDGGIAFMSTRRGGFIRCSNPWEPIPAYTLHRMDPDGGGIRTLSFHETNEWHPSVLGDGRIAYIRWDYVDRSAAHFHGLWTSNPDGTNASVLFGNYTQRINACYQPRAIPGSDRILFVAGAHHANVGGSLVVLDPARVAFDPASGQDAFDAIEVLTPKVCFAEAPGWPDTYFHSPWPLSEDFLLVSFSFDPLPGMGPGVNKDTETGIYLFDRFGNLELLFRQPGISCMYPIPLAPRIAPPVIPSTLDPDLGDEGELLLADVHRGHFPLPADRPIVELRIFQVLPKAETHIANQPRLGYANADSARMLLGTVPVESDGSARFRAPARKPLYFQAVDASGRAVQGMRSVVYLQPGERRSCVGCHEPRGATPPARATLAARRDPSRIQPGPDGTQPWSFPRLIQPILDARCVRCHGGEPGHHGPDLTAGPAGAFTRAYENLRPHVRWHEWGGASIDQIATRPGRMPADMSPLTRILEDPRHAGEIRLSDDERRRIELWLDGNSSFYGTYAKEAQLAQRHGEAVPPPSLQ